MSHRVKNWERFQHFKDRRPPWVKLYRELLNDPEWHELDGDTAKTLVNLWLIAADDETKQGLLPSTKKLAFRLRMSESKVVQQLTKMSHWLIQDDINAISSRYQEISPEGETDREEREEAETERNTPPDYAREKTKTLPFDELPTEWKKWAIEEKGWDDSIVSDVWSVFFEYWRNGKGKSQKKSNWDSTWRNWCRKENFQTKGKSNEHKNNSNGKSKLIAEGDRLADKYRQQAIDLDAQGETGASAEPDLHLAAAIREN